MRASFPSRRHAAPPALVDTRGSRSGYVYVAHSPDQPGSCKVGHTARPPHVRMKELGKTTWLAPVEVCMARFCWDAFTVERALHRALASCVRPGTEEWFDVPAAQVAPLLAAFVEAPLACRALCHSTNEGWLQTAFEWTLEQTSHPQAAFRSAAWRDMERLSALGYGPASWVVAERMMSGSHPPSRAVWVLDAARRQGHGPAALRGAWVGSFTANDPSRQEWKEHAARFLERFPDPLSWHEEDRATWEGELALWARHPSMAWTKAPSLD